MGLDQIKPKTAARNAEATEKPSHAHMAPEEIWQNIINLWQIEGFQHEFSNDPSYLAQQHVPLPLLQKIALLACRSGGWSRKWVCWACHPLPFWRFVLARSGFPLFPWAWAGVPQQIAQLIEVLRAFLRVPGWLIHPRLCMRGDGRAWPGRPVYLLRGPPLDQYFINGCLVCGKPRLCERLLVRRFCCFHGGSVYQWMLFVKSLWQSLWQKNGYNYKKAQ